MKRVVITSMESRIVYDIVQQSCLFQSLRIISFTIRILQTHVQNEVKKEKVAHIILSEMRGEETCFGMKKCHLSRSVAQIVSREEVSVSPETL